MQTYTSIYLALALAISANSIASADIYEGNSCDMEDGSKGICVQLPKCPMRIREVQEGKRFSTTRGRCSFENFVEIVCCPESEVKAQTAFAPRVTSTMTPTTTVRELSTTTMRVVNAYNDSSRLGVRPAEAACNEYEKGFANEDGKTINFNIFEGKKVKPGEFPFMVALGFKNDNETKYECGGSLITTKHVLTAAHCVNNFHKKRPVQVRLGTTTLNDTSVGVRVNEGQSATANLDKTSNSAQDIPIEEIISHPRYRPSQKYHDIAIIKLSAEVKITAYAMPICLQYQPILNLAVSVNTSRVVAGWGLTDFTASENSNDLLKTFDLQLIDRSTCDNYYNDSRNKLPYGIDDSMICMRAKDLTRASDACQGDSGGPLLHKTRNSASLIGVVAFGRSCGSSLPGVYTNVYHYLDWIEEIVWPEQKQTLRQAEIPKIDVRLQVDE